MANTNTTAVTEVSKLKRATMKASTTQLLDRGMYELIAVKLPKPEPRDRNSWFPVRRHTCKEYRADTWGEAPCKLDVKGGQADHDEGGRQEEGAKRGCRRASARLTTALSRRPVWIRSLRGEDTSPWQTKYA